MQMLRSMKDIQGYVLGAQDGEIGQCSDFLFDDKDWAVRYIVADTKKWLPGRKVLISPISIGDADGVSQTLNVGLTKEQIKNAPPLETDAPVSRRYEAAFNRYFDWAHYWGGPSVWGEALFPRLLRRTEENRQAPDNFEDRTRLRSAREVIGYHIQAMDKDIGHIEDFIVDQNMWVIRYLIIDTSNWLPASKRVLVAPTWADRVDWAKRKVLIDLTSKQVKNSPEFDYSLPVNREYETILYDYYGRPHYW